MAMNDLGKLFETTSLTRIQSIAVGAAVAANTGVVIFLGAEGHSTLSVLKVEDSKGNTYSIEQHSGATTAAIIYSRITTPLTATDTITVTLSVTPSNCWKSGHNFDNMGDTPFNVIKAAATATVCYATVDVSGSDWLALSVAYWPSSPLQTTTEVDSSVNQDGNGGISWAAECWSRNGTTGTTQQIGATVPTAAYRKLVGFALPAQTSAPAGRAAGHIFMGV